MISDQPSLTNLFRNSFYMFIGSGTVGMLQFIAVSLFITLYGVNGYGVFVILKLFLPTGLFLIFDFGISDTLVRFVSSNYRNLKAQQEFITFAIIIIFLVSILASYCLITQADTIANLFTFNSAWELNFFVDLLTLIGYAMPILFLGVVIESIFKGKEFFLTVSLIDFFVALGFVFILLYAPYSGWSLYDTISSYIFLLILKTVYLLISLIFHSAQILKFRIPSHKSIRNFINFSLTLFAGKACSLLSSNIPSFVLGTIDINYAGIFDALSRIPRFIKTLISKTSSTMLPYAAKMIHDMKSSELSNTLRLISAMQLYLWGPLIFILAFHSELILKLWLGSDLIIYYKYLSVFLILISFNCILSPLSAIATSSKETLKINNNINYGELILLSLLIIFFYKHNIEGVFISFYLSLIFKYILSYFFFRERIGFNINILKPFLVFLPISMLFTIFILTINTPVDIIFNIFYALIWILSSWYISLKFFLTKYEQQFINKVKARFLPENI